VPYQACLRWRRVSHADTPGYVFARPTRSVFLTNPMNQEMLSSTPSLRKKINPN
jgi:hypothetical protein